MHPKLHPAASDTKALQLRGSWSDIVDENSVIEIKSRNIKIHKANLFATCSRPSDLSGDSLTTLSGCKILLSWHGWYEECIEGPGSKAEWKNKKRCNTFSIFQLLPTKPWSKSSYTHKGCDQGSLSPHRPSKRWNIPWQTFTLNCWWHTSCEHAWCAWFLGGHLYRYTRGKRPNCYLGFTTF